MDSKEQIADIQRRRSMSAKWTVTFMAGKDGTPETWAPYGRYGYDGEKLRKPLALHVRFDLKMTSEGWQVEDTTFNVTSVNIKKDGTEGQRQGTYWLSRRGQFAELVDMATKAMRDEMGISK